MSGLWYEFDTWHDLQSRLDLLSDSKSFEHFRHFRIVKVIIGNPDRDVSFDDNGTDTGFCYFEARRTLSGSILHPCNSTSKP